MHFPNYSQKQTATTKEAILPQRKLNFLTNSRSKFSRTN